MAIQESHAKMEAKNKRKQTSKFVLSSLGSLIHRGNAENPSRLSTTSCERQRGVQFAPHVQLRHILSHHDYTSEEKCLTWFTGVEYMSIRKACAKQLFKMEAGEILRDRKYCSRGLEGQTKLGYMARQKARRASIDAVLDLQEELQAESPSSSSCDNDHDETIACVYRQATASRQLWATVVGLSDARAVEDVDDILLDDETNTLVEGKANSKAAANTPGVVTEAAVSYSSKSPRTTLYVNTCAATRNGSQFQKKSYSARSA